MELIFTAPYTQDLLLELIVQAKMSLSGFDLKHTLALAHSPLRGRVP